MQLPDVARLVCRAQSGDSRAFDALIRRFQDMAVGYCAAALGDFHLAEDAAQEAFLEAYRTLPALRAPEAFVACLRLTLRKQCDRVTRHKRISAVSLDSVMEIGGADDPVVVVAARERQLALRDAVRALPEAERVAILLFYIGQRSLKEVAAFLDVPISTVKNRLHAARRRLRERLSPTMEEAFRAQRPSRNKRFRGRIITRLYADFMQQFVRTCGARIGRCWTECATSCI